MVRPSGVSPVNLGVSVNLTAVPTRSVGPVGNRLLAIFTSEPPVTSVIFSARLLLVIRSGGALPVMSAVTVMVEVAATLICPLSCSVAAPPTATGPAMVQR